MRLYYAAIRAHCDRASPPTLTQYNQWGQRIDKLETSEGWRALKEVSQREGIPAIFYERKYGEYSRLYGFAKVFLMTGDCAEVSRVLLKDYRKSTLATDILSHEYD
jgi:hypothetical protein